jgi:MFS family permease
MALGSLVRLLFSPIAGVLVDRWDKVKIIYLTDFIRGSIFVVTAYVFFVGVENNIAIIILLTVTVLSGVISAFFGPAVTAATPEIVGLDKVQQANGANSIIQSSTMIAGVILGAAAFGLFPFYMAVLINGVSFLLSGFSETFIKAKHKEEMPNHEVPHMLEDMKVGFRYIKQKEGLLRMMIYSLFLNFAFNPLFSVGIPFLFREELSRGAWDIAWINIAFGIAMMIGGVAVGSLVIKSLSKVIRYGLLILSSSFVLVAVNIYMLSSGVFTYNVFYIVMIVLNVILAIAMMFVNVPLQTSMIKVIDPKLRGKVFSTIGAISGAAVPVAIFIAGPIIDLTNVAFLGIVCSAILLIPTGGYVFDKKVNNLLNSIEKDSKTVDSDLLKEELIEAV